MNIRSMCAEDLPRAAEVHKQAFARQRLSYEWLECTLQASPRTLCYVATVNRVVSAYIIWAQKSGFRPEAVLELEQIAVLPAWQGQGVGKRLIQESFLLVRIQLAKKGSIVKHIIVTTRADNQAQSLYKNTLNARVEATIANLYSADEVFMVARNVDLHPALAPVTD